MAHASSQAKVMPGDMPTGGFHNIAHRIAVGIGAANINVCRRPQRDRRVSEKCPIAGSHTASKAMTMPSARLTVHASSPTTWL